MSKSIMRIIIFIFALSAILSPIHSQVLAQNTNSSIKNENGKELDISNTVMQSKTSEEMLRNLAATYEARLSAMEMTNRTIDRVLQIGSWLGLALAAFAVIFSYIFGKSLLDIRKTAKDTAEAAIEDALRKTSGDNANLSTVILDVESGLTKLREIESELAGYVALSNVARSASGFDPLVEYLAIAGEINRRHAKTMRFLSGDDSIENRETIREPEFRQRAAVIFERLIESVRSSMKNGEIKVGPVMLYNAAATASKAEMDFVALELMETAEELSKGNAPEITSRLIRQRLSMAKCDNAEALSEITKVLKKTTGFDLHLVVSEAFNIGLHVADPVKVSGLIQEHLPISLQNVSYVLFSCARLMMMGNSSSEWEDGEGKYFKGLEIFRNESNTSRWYKSSATEIGRILEEKPSINKSNEAALMNAFQKYSNIEGFSREYGGELTRILIRMGIIEKFVDNIYSPDSNLGEIIKGFAEIVEKNDDLDED